jgi:coenzyme F420-0:L-glutamate ligase / coenzyme F420-1:gamma-L-glutamate ligase
MRIEITALPDLPEVNPGDDLNAILRDGLARAGIVAAPGDVLVVAQKVVSKSEGRIVDLAGVTPSARAVELADVAQKDPRIVELILRESVEVLRCVPGVIVVQDHRGLVMANAGIDASNVAGREDRVLLLPQDPDASARRLALALGLAVVINDSFGRAWRLGTCGTAIGVAGMPALLYLRGRLDRNGRPLITSELALADEVAAAASLAMGQADEGRPAIHLRGVPGIAGDGQAADLVRPRAKDLFR